MGIIIVNQRKKALLGIIYFLILKCVKQTPMSQQTIMNKIRIQFKFKIDPRAIYPILLSLKKHNLVDIRTCKNRKFYLLTNKGNIVNEVLVQDFSNMQKALFFWTKISG